MTRLLDTGMLETDDPVVAACFLDKLVFKRNFAGKPYALSALVIRGKDTGYPSDWPILITARVVAEVCSFRRNATTTEDFSDVFWHIAIALDVDNDDDGEGVLYDWLRKHVKENTHE